MCNIIDHGYCQACDYQRTARDFATCNSGVCDRAKLSRQATKATKAMKHIIASLEFSTLAAYLPTMLHRYTISQCHYHPLSSCVIIPLLSSCLPLFSYITCISTVCDLTFVLYEALTISICALPCADRRVNVSYTIMTHPVMRRWVHPL